MDRSANSRYRQLICSALILSSLVIFALLAATPVAGQAVCQNCGNNWQSPVAVPGGPYTGLTGQSIQLDGWGSYSYEGGITDYYWDFGDGTWGNGPCPNHQYTADGVYTVWLTVCDDMGYCAASQGFVTVDSVNVPVKLTFDELANNTLVYQQYLNLYGVTFYSGNSFYPVHAYQNCGFCSTTSPPNFISTKPDDSGQVTVEFNQPVSNLTFYIIGVDAFFNPFAILDVYRNGSLNGTYTLYGNGTSTVGITLGSTNNISKIVVRGITDAAGVGFDDFTFSVPSDIKITNGRVNGYLNGTTQNALLGADVALNANPLPSGFAGGTYAWTCTPSTSCSIINAANSSSVTLRTNEVGIFTATVSYTKNSLTASGSVTINSVLPTLTSFTAQQQSNFVWPPFTCGLPGEPTSLWWYRHGCHTSSPGINFNAHVSVDPFISDPTKSGVKYVQAYSTFHKLRSRGIRCETSRSSETAVESGWESDREDPTKDIYGRDAFMDFSGLLTAIGIDAKDSPGRALTHFEDKEFVDALYVDDRAEMYLMYYSGSDPYNPPIQRPLGKYAWNWGGLVVFDWNGSDAVHRERSPNPVLSSPSSTLPLRPPVHHDEVPCPDGSPFTNNPIDSSRVFVKYHYIDFLGRDPTPKPNANPPAPGDPVGWNFWTSTISECVFDLSCVHTKRVATGLAFFYSAEFIQTDPIMANPPGSPGFDREAYNRQFVYYCYVRYLHKPPDTEGWTFWTDDLNSNNNYGHTIDAFQSCSDYRNARVFE